MVKTESIDDLFSLKEIYERIELIDMIQFNLYEFAKESNEIEGIKHPDEHHRHKNALAWFIQQKSMSRKVLKIFCDKIQQGIRLRTEQKDAVFIGTKSGELIYTPPPGNLVPKLLSALIKKINTEKIHPYLAHYEYEKIHPFTDGNGRSGRALWLWHMHKLTGYDGSLKFLHKYYYQSLQQYRGQNN